jgi:hypothetical protein
MVVNPMLIVKVLVLGINGVKVKGVAYVHIVLSTDMFMGYFQSSSNDPSLNNTYLKTIPIPTLVDDSIFILRSH